MSETPTPPDHAAVKAELADTVLNTETLRDSEELADLQNQESIVTNITHLRGLLTAETDEENVELEQTALREAITAVAANHEGVSEMLIMMWINGEDIATSLEGLQERGVGTYQELLADEESIETIQRIGVDLGLDLGDMGENEDGVDGEYGARTRAAWEQVQQALVDAGYNLGEFGANNDGVDGAVGEVTMNVLLQAARGVAPDDVVDAAAAEAEGDDLAAEARLQREASFASIGEGAEADTAISEEHLDHYGENLASNTFGLFSYDPETNLLTERFGNNTLPLSQVIGSNYADADLPAAEERMMTFAVTQMQTLFNELGVEGDMVDGEIVIQHEGRTLTLNEAIANGGDDPVAYISDWLEDDHEETEIPAEHLTPLINRVQATSGVREVTENNTIVLFDGSEISLENVYAGIEGDITDYTPLENLNIALSQAAEPLTEALEMRFSPDRRNETFFSPAQFNKDDQFVFQLSELQAGELDPNFSGTRHPEAGAILQQALDVMGAAD